MQRRNKETYNRVDRKKKPDLAVMLSKNLLRLIDTHYFRGTSYIILKHKSSYAKAKYILIVFLNYISSQLYIFKWRRTVV